VIALPTWLHELASALTVTAAGMWLVWRWFRIGRPRGATPGCARCANNPGPGATALPVTGIRSPGLRVLR